MILDNNDVAILTKVNDLAERHGIKPYDFVASVRDSAADGTSETILAFEVVPNSNTGKQAQFFKMLDSIGAGQKTGRLEGTAKHIINALDHALHVAPKKRPRF